MLIFQQHQLLFELFPSCPCCFYNPYDTDCMTSKKNSVDIRKNPCSVYSLHLCPGQPWGLALSRNMGENSTFPSTTAQPEAPGLQGKMSHESNAGSHTKPSSKLSLTSERPDLCELQRPKKGQLEMRQCTKVAEICFELLETAETWTRQHKQAHRSTHLLPQINQEPPQPLLRDNHCFQLLLCKAVRTTH